MAHPKRLGIVGGIAPQSTIDYYRQIVDRYRERRGDDGYPELLIDSIDLTRMLALAAADRPGLTNYLLESLARLARGGADIALLAANTPHLVFDELRQRSPIPLISIVESVAAAAAALGLTRLGLLGTRFTMQARFYPDVLGRQGVSVIVPDVQEQEYVNDRYLRELVNGIFRPETRDRLREIMQRMHREERIEAVILGGTELPFLFRDGPDPGLPLLDSTRIHVERAVSEIL